MLQNLHHPGVVNLEQMFETPERVCVACCMASCLEWFGVGQFGAFDRSHVPVDGLKSASFEHLTGAVCM